MWRLTSTVYWFYCNRVHWSLFEAYGLQQHVYDWTGKTHTHITTAVLVRWRRSLLASKTGHRNQKVISEEMNFWTNWQHCHHWLSHCPPKRTTHAASRWPQNGGGHKMCCSLETHECLEPCSADSWRKLKHISKLKKTYIRKQVVDAVCCHVSVSCVRLLLIDLSVNHQPQATVAYFALHHLCHLQESSWHWQVCNNCYGSLSSKKTYLWVVYIES